MKLYTPSSTRLSGSAKETELRLRSIFQWKRRRLPMMFLTLVLAAAVGCGGLTACKGPAPQAIDMEDQLNILTRARDTWKALDETDWWGYAVTDLDQNGRLELIASETHGSGHFTTTRIWEVNETLDGLTVCKADENCGPVIGGALSLPVYYAEDTGLYWYVLQDYVQDGAWHYYKSLRTIALNRGQAEGHFLAFQETESLENGGEKTTYQDGQGKSITKSEYQQLTLNPLPSMEPMTACLSWVERQQLDKLDEETLHALLKGSAEGFALVTGSLPPADHNIAKGTSMGITDNSNSSTPEFLDDIAKTLSKLKDEHPDGEFIVNLDGFPDSAASCFGVPKADYVYYFFGGQDGDFKKAMTEYEDQLKCAGFITTANVLFPEIEDVMTFKDFFSLIGVEDYEYFGEDAITAEGWLKFTYNNMEVMVNTNEPAGDGWNVTGAGIVKSNAPVSIVNPEILNANEDLAESVMFD